VLLVLISTIKTNSTINSTNLRIHIHMFVSFTLDLLKINI